MFLVIDVLRSRVLFFVDLFLLGRRQRSAVGLAVRGKLLVDALLLILELGRFTCRQLPALDALGDAVLLIFAALPDFVVAVVRRVVGVVLVLVTTPPAKAGGFSSNACPYFRFRFRLKA